MHMHVRVHACECVSGPGGRRGWQHSVPWKLTEENVTAQADRGPARRGLHSWTEGAPRGWGWGESGGREAVGGGLAAGALLCVRDADTVQVAGWEAQEEAAGSSAAMGEGPSGGGRTCFLRALVGLPFRFFARVSPGSPGGGLG